MFWFPGWFAVELAKPFWRERLKQKQNKKNIFQLVSIWSSYKLSQFLVDFFHTKTQIQVFAPTFKFIQTCVSNCIWKKNHWWLLYCLKRKILSSFLNVHFKKFQSFVLESCCLNHQFSVSFFFSRLFSEFRLRF